MYLSVVFATMWFYYLQSCPIALPTSRYILLPYLFFLFLSMHYDNHYCRYPKYSLCSLCDLHPGHTAASAVAAYRPLINMFRRRNCVQLSAENPCGSCIHACPDGRIPISSPYVCSKLYTLSRPLPNGLGTATRPQGYSRTVRSWGGVVR